MGCDEGAFQTWRVNCVSLLEQAVRRSSSHISVIAEFSLAKNNTCSVANLTGMLKGLRDDFEHGFLDDLEGRIGAEMAADYMGQAEQLLTDGQSGKFDHVPAAVLAGAVLEKALRTLCGKQSPPLATVGADGKPLMLNSLIDTLKKTGAFNELVAKQLRAWGDIRNKAAHGEFDQFKRDDVELMLKGISSFLAEHLK